MDSPTSKVIDVTETYIREHGLLRPLTGIAAVLAVLAAFGVVLAGEQTVWWISGALIVVLVLALLAVNISRQEYRKRLTEANRVLALYGARLTSEIDGKRYEIIKWKERIEIQPSGHGRIRRWVTIRVADDAPLEAFWSRQSTHSPVMTEDIARKVVFSAHAVNGRGDIGARHVTSLEWTQLKACQAFVHLEQPIPAGETATFYMIWRWGKHFAGFVAGSPEPFQWKIVRPFGRLDVKVTVRKPPQRGLLSASEFPNSPVPKLTSRKDGGYVIAFGGEGFAVGQNVGFNAELSP